MDKVNDDFEFFRDLIETIPGEIEAVLPVHNQTLSRSELQDRLQAKLNEVKMKKSEKPYKQAKYVKSPKDKTSSTPEKKPKNKLKKEKKLKTAEKS